MIKVEEAVALPPYLELGSFIPNYFVPTKWSQANPMEFTVNTCCLV